MTCYSCVGSANNRINPIIAAVVAYIAWQQWRTNRGKLKLHLFDRRFALYDAERNLVRDVRTQTHPSDEQLQTFRAKNGEARFLLNQNIAKYLTDEMWEKATKLNRPWNERDNLQDRERQANQAQQAEIRVWFESQLALLELKFAEYLNLKH